MQHIDSRRDPSTAVTIRHATLGDLHSAASLLRDLGYLDLEPALLATTFRSVVQHPEMVIVLAETSDLGVVGLMSISWRPQLRLAGPIATIDELVVAERARGLGVGAVLIRAARAEAARLGARRLELVTNRDRESYRRQFYVKQGFFESNHALMRVEGPDLA